MTAKIVCAIAVLAWTAALALMVGYTCWQLPFVQSLCRLGRALLP